MAEISSARRYYWSVRREIWEYPSIWVAPLIAAVLAVAAYFVAALRASGELQRGVMDEPFTFVIGLIMATSYVVAIFYSLDALYGERRDRSILFWKSMPVSDLMTVLAKASIPLVVVPLVNFAATVVALIIIVLAPGAHPPLARTSGLLLYHLFAVHTFWWAPFFGWLLLVSAWAKRAPFVWAVVPVFAVTMLERIALNTAGVTGVLQNRLMFSPEAIVKEGTMPIDPATHITPWRFLSSADLWIGLAIAALCLVAAARLRRERGPS